MHPSFIPPRQVAIGDAAAFVGITPRATRHYEDIGLLSGVERGSDGRRRYGYDEMIRLLWIRRMADAGIALDDIRDAFGDTAASGADGDDVSGVLERLEANLIVQEAELQRQRTALKSMATRGSRLGLLDEFVAERLEGLPEGSLRRDDLDTLLVTERIFGPLGAAIQAGRFVALAADPRLREESDRVDAAEEALHDSVAVDDPRVARVAAERHAFEVALFAAIDASGQPGDDDALLDAWDARHPEGVETGDDATGDDATGRRSAPRRGSEGVAAVISKMPYDFSPARVRCLELAQELAAEALLTAEPPRGSGEASVAEVSPR